MKKKNKTLLYTSLASLALAGLSSLEASAEEQTNSLAPVEPTITETLEEATGPSLTTEEKPVAEIPLADAQATVDQLKQEAQAAQDALTLAEQDLTKNTQEASQLAEQVKQATVTVAQAQARAQEASPEKVAEIQEQLDTLTSNVTTAQEQLQAADRTYARAQEALRQAEAQASTTSTEQALAAQQVKQAELELQQLQANFNQQSPEELVKQIEQTQEAIQLDEKALAQAQNQLAAAQELLARIQADPNQAPAGTPLRQALEAVTTAEQQLQEAQSKLLQQEKHLRALTNYVIKSVSTADEVENDEGKNRFWNNMWDVTYSGARTETLPYDPHFVPNSRAVAHEMFNLLKELRQINGVPSHNLRMTEDAMAYAAFREREITNFDSSVHNTSNLYTPKGYKRFYENLHTSLASDGRTAGSNREVAYRILLGYFSEYQNIFNTYGHTHALFYPNDAEVGITYGDKYSTLIYTKPANYVVPASEMGDYWGGNGRTFRVVWKNGKMEYQINGRKAVFLPKITFNYQGALPESQLQTQLKGYRQAVQQATSRVAQAKEAIRTQQTASGVNLNLSDLTKQIQAKEASLAQHQDQLTQLRQQLAQQDLSQATREEAVNLALTALAQATDNLTKAEAQLASDQSEVNRRQVDLAQAEQELIAVKADLVTLLNKLDATTKELASLQEAPLLLQAAQEQLQALTQRLAAQQAKAAALFTTVQELQAVRDSKRQAYDKAQAALLLLNTKSLQTTPKQEQPKATTAPNRPAVLPETLVTTPLQVRDGKASTALPLEQTQVTPLATKNTGETLLTQLARPAQTPVANQTRPTADRLPQTGEATSLLSLLGASLMGLGIRAAKRRD